jgi:hypothetical protein
VNRPPSRSPRARPGSRRGRPAGAPALLVLVALIASLAACGDGSPVDRGSNATPPMRAGSRIAATVDSALFTVDCRFSHRAPVDPIVFPGRPGASHVHDFFGAEGTDADSTAASLRGGPTTCADRHDTAAYWVPALYDGTRPVDPELVRAYYRAAPGADVDEVQVLPEGIELIEGDMHRPAGDWPSLDRVAWGCGLRPASVHHRPPPNCTVSSPLTLRLVFADCWDGRRATSADHRSHVAHSTRGHCPSAHPVPILQVQLSVQYPVWRPTDVAASPRAADLVLASGRWEGSHGDVLNGWDQARLEQETELCIRAMANCTIG